MEHEEHPTRLLRVVDPGETRRAPVRVPAVQVTNEVGLLHSVVVHTPGREMELVSPENRADLLFEDILFAERARKEHLTMCTLIEKMVGRKDAVLQVEKLLREVFSVEEARHEFIDQLCAISTEYNLQVFEGQLKRLSPEELHLFAITGASPLPLHALPVPNLLFIRDVAAVVHDHIIVSHPATAARARESVIIHVILRHHPLFAGYRDRIVTLPEGITFEGGDLLMASPKVALVGHSERTSFGGVMSLAQELFDRTPVEHVLMIDLPKRRSTMHLDTAFTFCSEDECVVYPPLLVHGNAGNVVHFTPGAGRGRFEGQIRPNFKEALEELLERPLTFIPCGGNDPLSQQREQWTDAANFLAIAPGVVVGYERNNRTYDMMRKHGYQVVTAQNLLSFYEESEYRPGEKIAIKLEGNELSRGRGGPRCMTLPIRRAEINDPNTEEAA